MITPVQQAFGAIAKTMLQSVLDGIEDRRKQDDEKRPGSRKDDPLLKARIASDETKKRAQEKIASNMFDMQHPDANESRVQLGFQLARKLGLDVDSLESNGTLGSALENALSRLGDREKDRLAREAGLDQRGLTLDDVVASIRLDNPFREKTPVEAASQKKSDPFFEDDKIRQRLEDAARERSAAERTLTLQDPRAGRVVDSETVAEDLRDIRSTEALEKLKETRQLEEKATETPEAGPLREGPVVAVPADGEATNKPDSTGAVDPDRQDGAKAVSHPGRGKVAGLEKIAFPLAGFVFMPQLDDVGLYSNVDLSIR